MGDVTIDRHALGLVLNLARDLEYETGVSAEYEAAIQTATEALDAPTYSHRNGETTDPEVEGHYWINYWPTDGEEPYWRVDWWHNGDWWAGNHIYGTASYYGPIPQPQRKEE